MACTARLVCLFSTVISRSRKKEKKSRKCLERCGACSGHITKLEQSIFFRYLWFQVTKAASPKCINCLVAHLHMGPISH
jgi:hypothetical protein